MANEKSRWILAFDASCGACAEIAGVVGRACDGKITTMSLTHPDVQRWRELRLGPQAPWSPTLLAVGPGDDEVRAWTGAAMAVRLVRRLGVRSTMQILNALGKEERDFERRPGRADDGQLKRAQFLRLGAGAAVAVGLVAAGQIPAFAAGQSDAARKWARANADRLPASYHELITYSPAYRKAIYQASPAAVRSKFWVEQINRYRAGHPALSPGKSQVLQRAAALAGTTSVFEPGSSSGEQREQHARLGGLRAAVIGEFGPDEAFSILGTLGPATRSAPQRPADEACQCATQDSYCDNNTTCQNYGGCSQVSGCGTFWAYTCDGLCYNG
jgi:hypothetical protein